MDISTRSKAALGVNYVEKNFKSESYDMLLTNVQITAKMELNSINYEIR